jgi:hypothetical protein
VPRSVESNEKQLRSGVTLLLLCSIICSKEYKTTIFWLPTVEINNSLAPWSRVLLEKLTVTQLVRNSPPFMESEGSLPILSQMHPVHIFPPCFPKICSDIFSSTPRSSARFLTYCSLWNLFARMETQQCTLCSAYS